MQKISYLLMCVVFSCGLMNGADGHKAVKPIPLAKKVVSKKQCQVAMVLAGYFGTTSSQKKKNKKLKKDEGLRLEPRSFFEQFFTGKLPDCYYCCCKREGNK